MITRSCRKLTGRRRYFFSTAALAAFFGLGIDKIQGMMRDSFNIQSLFALGLGAANAKTLMQIGLPTQGASALIKNVLVANLPQLTLSLIYYNINAIITCMALAAEWSDFGKERKGLRVSTPPRGSQRNTYSLQLPYRFAVPLIVVSGILHLLASQSIFFS